MVELPWTGALLVRHTVHVKWQVCEPVRPPTQPDAETVLRSRANGKKRNKNEKYLGQLWICFLLLSNPLRALPPKQGKIENCVHYRRSWEKIDAHTILVKTHRRLARKTNGQSGDPDGWSPDNRQDPLDDVDGGSTGLAMKKGKQDVRDVDGDS